MRWKFARDEQAYAETIRRIDSWWQAFEGKTEQLDAFFSRRDVWDVPQWMNDHLQRIDENLMWEFGPGLNGGHRLVITPEVNRHLRPLVEIILDRAPKLDGWEFHGARPPEPYDTALQKLEAQGVPPLSEPQAVVAQSEHNLLDLTFFSPDIRGPDDRAATHAAFIMTEALAGEQALDTWVGPISVQSGTPPAGAVPVQKLGIAVLNQIAGIYATLPDKPIWQLRNDSAWTVWQADPGEADDYPAQEDVYVAKSMFPEMWLAAGSRFCSERFSRHGEVFCYVKIDGSSEPKEESGWSDIEDALDSALRTSEAGAVIGGARGLRYAYVDLALADPERGIRKVIEALRERNIAKRSWILFFDADYGEEWVGIWDDSPPPPGL